MPWDSIPGTETGETGVRPRISLAAALKEEYPDAVAIDASLAKGRAYLAIRDADGQIRPAYLWLERFPGEPGDDPIVAKAIPVDESPLRWPKQVAAPLTTWEE
ncbi:hypothetical protein JOF57_006229 [Mycolicibacterium lutetiense]|uniref:Uncharacterized protein n=1 Tax=Mycolicibacterium lutetiense TaxID=1641992 RepID=A0ABS5A3C6_9MYCO|nr:hypothetical protein [Mycolicibacterium lutetiense]